MNPAGMYNTTATVHERTPVLGSDGSVTYSSTDTGIVCAVNPMSPREVIQYNRPFGTIMARLYCDSDVAIDIKNTVDWSGATWKVVGKAINVGGRSVFQTVILERVV